MGKKKTWQGGGTSPGLCLRPQPGSSLHLLHPTPFQHQQQVLGAIERAKQVTAPELNSIIRVRLGSRVGGWLAGGLEVADAPPPVLQQQLQAHQLSQLQALALPLTPLPVGLQPPSLPAVSGGTGLLSLSALGSQAHLSKEDKNGHDGDTHQEDDGEKSD